MKAAAAGREWARGRARDAVADLPPHSRHAEEVLEPAVEGVRVRPENLPRGGRRTHREGRRTERQHADEDREPEESATAAQRVAVRHELVQVVLLGLRLERRQLQAGEGDAGGLLLQRLEADGLQRHRLQLLAARARRHVERHRHAGLDRVQDVRVDAHIAHPAREGHRRQLLVGGEEVVLRVKEVAARGILGAHHLEHRHRVGFAASEVLRPLLVQARQPLFAAREIDVAAHPAAHARQHLLRRRLGELVGTIVLHAGVARQDTALRPLRHRVVQARRELVVRLERGEDQLLRAVAKLAQRRHYPLFARVEAIGVALGVARRVACHRHVARAHRSGLPGGAARSARGGLLILGQLSRRQRRGVGQLEGRQRLCAQHGRSVCVMLFWGGGGWGLGEWVRGLSLALPIPSSLSPLPPPQKKIPPHGHPHAHARNHASRGRHIGEDDR